MARTQTKDITPSDRLLKACVMSEQRIKQLEDALWQIIALTDYKDKINIIARDALGREEFASRVAGLDKDSN
jgi:hypothetical protein